MTPQQKKSYQLVPPRKAKKSKKAKRNLRPKKMAVIAHCFFGHQLKNSSGYPVVLPDRSEVGPTV